MSSYTMVCITDNTTVISSELFHNNTPTASVSNYCGFYYTSRQDLTFVPSTIWEYLFFLTLHEAYDTLQNYKTFSTLFQWSISETRLLPKYPGYVNYVRVSTYSYLYTHQAFNSWSIWNHIHLIDLISVPAILKVSKPIALDYRSRCRFTRMHTLLL